MNRFIYGSSIIFLHYKTLTESPTPSQVQHMQRQRQKPWNMSSSKCKNLSTHFWPSHIHGVGGVCWYENLHCLHSPKADSRWKVVSSFNTLAKAQVARFWTLFHLFSWRTPRCCALKHQSFSTHFQSIVCAVVLWAGIHTLSLSEKHIPFAPSGGSKTQLKIYFIIFNQLSLKKCRFFSVSNRWKRTCLLLCEHLGVVEMGKAKG